MITDDLYREYPKLLQTQVFAEEAHQGQFRKYTGEPYITHPIAVMEIVSTVKHTEVMLQAALLHDVVEDTHFDFNDIEDEFGPEVTGLVYWLTDISRPHHGNRETRKAMDALHYSRGPAESQTVKVADLIHNTECIAKEDPNFWELYKHEKLHSLNLLTKADPGLLERAHRQLDVLW